MTDVADPAFDALDAFIKEQNVERTSLGWRTDLSRPPQVAFDPERTYTWTLKTNKGLLSIRLMPEVAPMHVSSTVFLTRMGFYDDLVFHRVINGFMAQGGCPAGKGTGGPGYSYDGEFSADVRHDRRGLLSMANAGPGTDGSQFFITFVAAPHLDNKHTLFGEVVDGFDVLDALEAAGSPSGAPKERLVIEKADVVVS